MKRIAVVLLVLLAACGSDDKAPRAATTTTTTTTTSAFSTSPVSTPENSEQGELTAIDVGAHDGFVRVVFRFSNLVPGYSVKPASPPFVQDGSGNTVTIAGNGHLAVRLTARAHDEAGASTVAGTIAGPSGGSVTQVVMTGDFEGVVNAVIGTTVPKGFKVFTLSNPARLVIDVQSP